MWGASLMTEPSINEQFERLAKVAENGKPYWTARELMVVLDYRTWRDFRQVTERAQESCEAAGHVATNHFVRMLKMVSIGSGARREREDIVLSQYACYLVAMNGDPSKAEVAAAQAYFVEQTYKQEQQQQLTDLERRAMLRDRVRDANRTLFGVARGAGVSNQMFGVFNDAGYRGLYGERGLKEIKRLKKIGDKDDLLDCIGHTELAANEFRVTQAQDKLKREQVHGEAAAIRTHHSVGLAVRRTIEELGGTMPEKLPPAPSIKGIKKKLTGASDGSRQEEVRQLAAPHDAEPAGTCEDDKDEAR